MPPPPPLSGMSQLGRLLTPDLSSNVTPQGALITLHPGLHVPSLYFSKALLLPLHTLTVVRNHDLDGELISVCLFHSTEGFKEAVSGQLAHHCSSWHKGPHPRVVILQISAWTWHRSGAYQEN